MSQKSQECSLKKCKMCGEEKELTEFHLKKSASDGRDGRCMTCSSEYKRKYRMDNIDRYKESRKKSYEKEKMRDDFKEKRYFYAKEYYSKNKDLIKEKVKSWRGENREKSNATMREWQRNKRKTDIRYRMNTNIGNSLREALDGRKRGRSWTKFVDYDIDRLIKHLESLFTTNMSWENYGNPNGDNSDCWHIDHIIPVTSFDFNDLDQVRLCWSLSNLMPRWAKTETAIKNGEPCGYVGNLEKGNRCE